MRKDLRNSLILIGIVILCVAVFLISWFVFPEWKIITGGLLFLAVVVFLKVPKAIGEIADSVLKVSALFRKDQAKETDIKPLRKVTLDELDRRFEYDGSKVKYVDRRITSIKTLNDHGKIVITGAMKTGKTREAVQLIHEMVEQNKIGEDCIYRINFGYLINLEERILSHQLGVDFDRPVLLFIDDLPHHYKKAQLDWLRGLIQALKRCKELWVVATARIDQLDAVHYEWFKQIGIQELSIKKFKNDQFLELVKNCADLFDLAIEDAALYVFLRNKERNPEHILICMQRLKSQGITVITKEKAFEINKQTLVDTWANTRRKILEDRPAAKYLFESLACFYDLNIITSEYFIIHLANYLWVEDRVAGNPGKKGIQQLNNAFEYLEKDVLFRYGDRVMIADYKVEGLVEINKAEERVENFLFNHRKLFHRRFLRHFYQQARNHASLLFLIGEYHYYKGNREKPILLLNVALRLHQSAILYSNMGLLLFKGGRKAEAENLYRLAIEKNAEDAKAYFNLGLLLVDLERKAEAEEMFQIAIEKDAEFAKAYYNLGNLLAGEGRKAEAEGLYRLAIEKDAESAPSYNNLGVLLVDLGRKVEAEEMYRMAIEKDAEHAKTYNNLGVLLIDLGRKEEAEEMYRKTIEKDAEFASAYYNLGNLLAGEGKKAEAEQMYRMAIEKDVEYASAYTNLGLLLAGEGRKAEAKAMYRKAIEKNAKYAQAYYNLACLASLEHDTEKVFGLLKIVVELGVDIAWAWKDDDLAWLRDDPRFIEIVGPSPEEE